MAKLMERHQHAKRNNEGHQRMQNIHEFNSVKE
jgi:hypothetical protein